ncbi:flagellar biosynthesis protein FlhF [Helicobacter turcicus]|uniref:Flagellar biosynthesis protein FlhF n=1 Tax=Helicobacter turcicus TaxID=2867412 RepID=A0ABS7JLX4_9HELI|nr:flagellar biosynthesis protein FlhF [Helicobacter turcicus]MBX7490398.1 flagellar biosynthesis protein FlhF [Helicobacter turcicus]MBX7545256.1 flagellar biosynthesis protein FlhF [Helicobacter turcicus]
MKLFTFTAETGAQALAEAKRELGDEFSIIAQKKLSDGKYEVSVAISEEDLKQAKTKQQQEESKPKTNNIAERLERIAQKEIERKRIAQSMPTLPEDVSLQLSDAVRQISQIAGVESKAPAKSPYGTQKATPKEPEQAQSPKQIEFKKEDSKDSKPQNKKEAQSDDLRAIRGEIDRLNDKLKLIQNMFWEERGPKSDGLIIPHEFAEIYRITKASGMAKEHLEKIMQLTLELMPIKMRENSVLIKRYFREVLRKMVVARTENLSSNAKNIIMLVGPTGVGKTTTLAKLAARYSRLLNKNYKVGIITLDTYRIGAVDQLMFYAKKMKLSIDTVVDTEEFVNALDSLKYCDYILIDTVGSSQHDRAKLESLKSFVNADPNAKIDVSLVMSATTKYEDLKDIYHTFSMLGIDTLVFTKLDETHSYGNIFSLIYETKKPVSYFSIGQEVPNDLNVATSDFLIDCLLDGLIK